MCQVCTRRNFIRVSSAAVGSLALRPFGLLPALAQSPTDYRALVCVFLSRSGAAPAVSFRDCHSRFFFGRRLDRFTFTHKA